MTTKLITISELATLFNINQHTIRHYEDKGLLLPFEISPNGYRKYSMTEAYQLSFILFFKELGLSLKEIKNLLKEPDNQDYQELLVAKQEAIKKEQQRLTELSQLIDQQLTITQASVVKNYHVTEPLYLQVVKELPLEQPFDLAVLSDTKWSPDYLLGTLYYVISENQYAICVKSPTKTAQSISPGNYQYQLLEAESDLELDEQLTQVINQQGFPLIVIEDGSRFLTKGQKIAVKVLGASDA